jgi:hypothetical protein
LLKFGRIYEINIQTKSGDILTIKLPFTCEFDIQRNALSSANVASFKLYNLEESHRSAIQKNINDVGDLRTITFKAGYSSINIPVCFRGMISQCYSYKQSRVDIVTEIQSFDGGFVFANAPTVATQTFPAGTPRQAMIQPLLNALPGNNQGQVVQLGAVGRAVQGTLSRSNSFSEHPLEVLKNWTSTTPTSSGFFIDLGKAYILEDNECIPSDGINVIDASAGLLETPIWEQSIIHYSMLFEPRLIMAQRVKLVTLTNPTLNHDYKVVSLGHRGTISDSVCGDAITNVGLFAPFVVSELVDIPA